VTSGARLNANRENARASTGPTSSAGKARCSRNARRHGLAVPVWSNPDRAAQIAALASSLAGGDPSAALTSAAYDVAEACVDLERVRERRQQLIERFRHQSPEPEQTVGPPQSSDNTLYSETDGSKFSDLIAKLHALDRYEQRALSRRNRSTIAFDTIRVLEDLQHRPQ